MVMALLTSQDLRFLYRACTRLSQVGLAQCLSAIVVLAKDLS